MTPSGRQGGSTTPHPRQLRSKERNAIEFVLPAGHPGYEEYRSIIAGMSVIGSGRRGPGNFILGTAGDTPDITSPLASVIAYGMIETTQDTFSITVREYIGAQIDVEIVGGRGEEIPEHYEEKRRWTYSCWLPGEPSPATDAMPREVPINETLTLAIVPGEKRMWLHDGAKKMNHLIPITNYYNELMLHKSIRDPDIALQSVLLFEQLAEYTDEDLRSAFLTYNRVHKKVDIAMPEPRKTEETGIVAKFIQLFRKKKP